MLHLSLRKIARITRRIDALFCSSQGISLWDCDALQTWLDCCHVLCLLFLWLFPDVLSGGKSALAPGHGCARTSLSSRHGRSLQPEGVTSLASKDGTDARSWRSSCFLQIVTATTFFIRRRTIEPRHWGAQEAPGGALECQAACSHPASAAWFCLLAQLCFPGRPQPPVGLVWFPHSLLLCRWDLPTFWLAYIRVSHSVYNQVAFRDLFWKQTVHLTQFGFHISSVSLEGHQNNLFLLFLPS